MTGLLIFLVLVLLTVAIWQLTKIFHLTQSRKTDDDKSPVATDKDNKTNGYMMFVFLGIIYLVTILSFIYCGDFPLVSNSASAHGKEVDRLMIISMAMIFVVQTITQALLHYFAFKYRGKKGNVATYFADNNKLEFIWSSIPAVVLAVLIFYGLYAWNDIMFVDKDDKDIMVVEVYAQQFKWTVRYSGKDNVLGKANVRYIEGVNVLGVDLSDPNAQDDIVTDELHLPKGKKVVFKIRSQDVLHSMYMPHFRAQMNAVPGMVTQFAFTPIITTDDMRETPEMVEKVDNINKIRNEKSKDLVAAGQTALDPYEFNFLLLCNKICGASHYNMQMKIVVDTPSDYKKWIASKEKLVAAVKTAALADAASKTDATSNVVKKDSLMAKPDTTVVAKNEVK